jgi:hypothetical protein
MLSGFFPQIGVLLARSRVRDLVGEFDEALLGGQDLDWQLRIARRRTLGFVPSPCLLFRGRPPGTYNALQLKRVGYDRVVFSRHALPEWRIWRSPLQLLQAYTGSLQHFYWYFFTVAIAQAERGERSLALRAIGGAFLVFPFRALFHLVTRPQFRQALLGTIPAVRAFDPPAA